MTAPDKLRAAVVGAGYMGRLHAQKYAALEGVELIGVVDLDRARAAAVAAELGARAFDDPGEILERADLVSIAVPPRFHYAVARDSLEAGCHVLLEKPITETIEEAEQLIRLAHERRLVLQVGHLERFNSALQALEGSPHSPRFIEAYRLARFNSRGIEVDVVLDLMIHDIDIVLSLVPSKVGRIESAGSPIVSRQLDIANARLEFENGCVANLTASRVSESAMRTLKIFQPDSCVSIDFLERTVTRIGKASPHLPAVTTRTGFERSDALLEQARAFVTAARLRTAPRVTGEDGRRALELALQIKRELRR